LGEPLIAADAEPRTMLGGARIIAALAEARVEFVLAVPDIVTARGVLTPIAKDERFRLVRVCKEDECIGIASALAVCRRRSVSLFQNTGFLDSINAIAHTGVQFKLPVVMMIGLLAHEAGTRPEDSTRASVRIVKPMLDAMGVESVLIDSDEDVAQIAARIDEAYERSKPLAFLIGRRPAP
jgi:sulfopyruvate decarboxylase TPP-binding subunit